jgi:hypothetical protein
MKTWVHCHALGCLLASALWLFGGCASERTPVSQWRGFGNPGPGKIAVTIAGAIEHPGKYFMDGDATLDSALFVFGEFEWSGGLSPQDGLSPSMVELLRQTDAGRSSRRFKFWTMSKSEREAVQLLDGDVLWFAKIVF